MIVSVSRRTDIPAFFADWFYARLQEGFAVTHNPVNFKQAKRVDLNAQSVDGFVFWTKNPTPMLPRLHLLQPYAYYFQFTITPYSAEIEPNIPDKDLVVIPAFLQLAQKLGPHRVIWRYDPVFCNEKYTQEYHFAAFERIARQLQGATNTCIFSFMQPYQNTKRNAQVLRAQPLDDENQLAMARMFAQIAAAYGMQLQTCAMPQNYLPLGITPAACINAQLLTQIRGAPVPNKKDTNQRAHCNCAAAVDIGAYNTCPGSCQYCYANYQPALIDRNLRAHSVQSPALVER